MFKLQKRSEIAGLEFFQIKSEIHDEGIFLLSDFALFFFSFSSSHQSPMMRVFRRQLHINYSAPLIEPNPTREGQERQR